ncbi:MAG: 50S ribosomal protein L11 methyltransferase [Chitinophagaceae bacterium]
MEFIQVNIPFPDHSISEIIIAVLADKGFLGFEERETELLGYIPSKEFDSERLKILLEPFHIQYSTQIVEDENWNATWEAEFKPIRVENFCGIRTSAHPFMEDVFLQILINPRLTFGTGHHPTTYSMIKLMSTLNFAGKRVLDYGTGTGILAILAAKLGASFIKGIDQDINAVRNAQENVEMNGVKNISIEMASQLPSLEMDHFDIILMNIHLNIIINYLGSIFNGLKKGGCLLVSGILLKDDKIMFTNAKAQGFVLLNQFILEDWLTILWVKQ